MKQVLFLACFRAALHGKNILSSSISFIKGIAAFHLILVVTAKEVSQLFPVWFCLTFFRQILLRLFRFFLEFLYHPMSLRESAPVHVVRHRQLQTGYYKSPADY